MTFGFQMQRLEENASVYDGPTSALTISYNTPETASIVPSGSSSAYGGNTGYSYASFLLGAVNGTGSLCSHSRFWADDSTPMRLTSRTSGR
jgi:hypothetical protein